MHRLAMLGMLAMAAPARAQTLSGVDLLVARVTHGWGPAPEGGWRAEWSVVRGDSAALRAGDAVITGSERSGIYTITMRPSRFAAPTLVARLRVGHEHREVVAARPITRGALLTSDDVALRRALVWGAPHDTTVPSHIVLVGAEARRTMRDGEPIRDSDVVAPPVVFAGDSVTAEFIRDGVRLALVGTALHDAPLGARVAIRFDRGRRFAGIATGRNTVRLD
ncbi:MAG TPA: flagellar basal body P-ring formation chaperone FlgA [Gemmatimonadaceae bacterium]|nr:flagellar basal body P-ring formation chaperone FlgA [Gemmatimonadaceae bacterium]